MKTSEIFFARATRSAYYVLVLPHIILALISSISIYFLRPDIPFEGIKPAFVFLFIGMAFFIWLKGLYLKITEDRFIYRNGIYQTQSLYLDEISEITLGYEYFKNIGQKASVPRYIVIPKDKARNPIVINIKPFSLEDLRKFYKIMEREIEKRK